MISLCRRQGFSLAALLRLQAAKALVNADGLFSWSNPVAAQPEPLPQPARNARDRLPVKLEAAWQDLSDCASGISRASTVVQSTPSEPRRLTALRDWYDET